jgi:hypothetical protein
VYVAVLHFTQLLSAKVAGELGVSTPNNKRLSMNLKYLLPILFLAGCASNSGIVPMGNDTYMVSRQAASGFSGMGTLKADAMREAYSQCQKTGKRVEVIETIDAKPPYIFGNFPKTEIRFKCVQ